MPASESPDGTPLPLSDIFRKRPWNDPEWRSPEGRTWTELLVAADERTPVADEAFMGQLRAFAEVDGHE